RTLPRRLQPARHALDHLAVQDDDLEVTQRSGDRVGQRRHLGLGEDLAEAVGALGQEGFANGQGQVAELGGGGGEGRLEGGVALGVTEALVPGAVGLKQGVADEVGHHREGDLSLVRAPAVAVVELAEGVVVAEELPEREGGLGEGEAGQHFAVKVLWHGPVLGTRRDRSPTPRMAVSYDLDRPGKQWTAPPATGIRVWGAVKRKPAGCNPWASL